MKDWPLGLWRSLSGTGLLLGTLFFAASLTPTLIPRTYLTQGVLGGGVFAIGYGLGVFWRWLWSYMELPTPEQRHLRIANLVIAFFCAVDGSGVFVAHRRMAEFDPRADGARAGHERAPVQGMCGGGGDLRHCCWDSPGSLR